MVRLVKSRTPHKSSYTPKLALRGLRGPNESPAKRPSSACVGTAGPFLSADLNGPIRTPRGRNTMSLVALPSFTRSSVFVPGLTQHTVLSTGFVVRPHTAPAKLFSQYAPDIDVEETVCRRLADSFLSSEVKDLGEESFDFPDPVSGEFAKEESDKLKFAKEEDILIHDQESSDDAESLSDLISKKLVVFQQRLVVLEIKRILSSKEVSSVWDAEHLDSLVQTKSPNHSSNILCADLDVKYHKLVNRVQTLRLAASEVESSIIPLEKRLALLKGKLNVLKLRDKVHEQGQVENSMEVVVLTESCETLYNSRQQVNDRIRRIEHVLQSLMSIISSMETVEDIGGLAEAIPFEEKLEKLDSHDSWAPVEGDDRIEESIHRAEKVFEGDVGTLSGEAFEEACEDQQLEGPFPVVSTPEIQDTESLILERQVKDFRETKSHVNESLETSKEPGVDTSTDHKIEERIVDEVTETAEVSVTVADKTEEVAIGKVGEDDIVRSSHEGNMKDDKLDISVTVLNTPDGNGLAKQETPPEFSVVQRPEEKNDGDQELPLKKVVGTLEEAVVDKVPIDNTLVDGIEQIVERTDAVNLKQVNQHDSKEQWNSTAEHWREEWKQELRREESSLKESQEEMTEPSERAENAEQKESYLATSASAKVTKSVDELHFEEAVDSMELKRMWHIACPHCDSFLGLEMVDNIVVKFASRYPTPLPTLSRVYTACKLPSYISFEQFEMLFQVTHQYLMLLALFPQLCINPSRRVDFTEFVAGHRQLGLSLAGYYNTSDYRPLLLSEYNAVQQDSRKMIHFEDFCLAVALKLYNVRLRRAVT